MMTKQLERYGRGFIPPSGAHDATCAFLCKDPRACARACKEDEHSCKVCDAKARKEGRIR